MQDEMEQQGAVEDPAREVGEVIPGVIETRPDPDDPEPDAPSFLNLHQIVEEALVAPEEPNKLLNTKVAAVKLPAEVHDLLEGLLRAQSANKANPLTINAFFKKVVYVYLREHLTPSAAELAG